MNKIVALIKKTIKQTEKINLLDLGILANLLRGLLAEGA